MANVKRNESDDYVRPGVPIVISKVGGQNYEWWITATDGSTEGHAEIDGFIASILIRELELRLVSKQLSEPNG